MQKPPRALDEATDATVRALMFAGLVPALVLGVVVLLVVHPLAGLLVALVVVGGWAWLVWHRASTASTRLLGSLQTSELPPGGEPRLQNLLESVCAVSGIEEPQVRVVDEASLNAVAVADRSGSTLVVTRGLLSGLGRVELEGVLANLAARVKGGSARYATTVLALPLPSSYTAKLLQDGFGAQSSVRSDLAAVGLTKYPPGLIKALGVMERQGTAVSAAGPRTAPMWLADPQPGGRGPNDVADELAPEPLSLRIAVLQEL